MTSRLGPKYEKEQVNGQPSRAFLAAANMKARVVTCYRNGKQFEHGVRVSFIPGKTFPDIDHLMDYLTNKCPDVQNGVRYIFTMTGKMVLRLDELENGQKYVISGVKQFQFLPYGQGEHSSDSSNSVKSFNGFDRNRGQHAGLERSQMSRSDNGLGTLRQTGLRNGTDVNIVTLVNSRNPSVRSRVILNLRTPKSFDSVLRDLGDAVQVVNPKKLLNERGLEVRSFSQLRRELNKNKLFFLDSSISEDSSSSGNSRRLIDRPVMKDTRIRSGSVPPTEKMEKMSDLPKSKFQLESLYRNEVQNDQNSGSAASREDSGILAALSKFDTPTPDKTELQETQDQNPRSTPVQHDSWREGLSLDNMSNSYTDRINLSFEEKLKNELEKAYAVLNNDVRGTNSRQQMLSLDRESVQSKTMAYKSPGPKSPIVSSSANNLSSVTPPSNETANDLNGEDDLINGHTNFRPPSSPSFHAYEGVNMPTKDFSIERIYGFSSDSGPTGNLSCLASGELIYFVAGIIVMWDQNRDKQRFYCEHSRDVSGITVFEGRTVASVEQEYVRDSERFARVRIWNAVTLVTEATFEESLGNQKLLGVFFAPNGNLLVLKGDDVSVSGRIWSWKSSRKRVATAFHHHVLPDEFVKSAIFHPRDEDIVVTFGQEHLILWQLIPDKTGTERKTQLKNPTRGLKGKVTVNTATFLLDDTLLTGNTQGQLVLWAPVPGDDTSLDFMQRVYQGHRAAISMIRLLGSHTIASSDFEGEIRIWEVREGRFDLLTSAQLTPDVGSIISLHLLPNRIDVLYATTGFDQGNPLGILCLTVHPKEESFFTSSGDNRLQKWDPRHGVEWETTLPSKGSSISVHPSGEVLAVASDSGEIVLLSTSEGVQLSLLPVSESALTCVAYSHSGDVLAAGSLNGSLNFMQVADEGLSYQSLSILKLKNESPITSVQWSIDGQYVLTNVESSGGLRELVLWDLRKGRFMAGLDAIPDNIDWKDPVWSQSEHVRGLWNNDNFSSSVLSLVGSISHANHLLACGDDTGTIRLFSYPCNDSRAGYFQRRQGSSSVGSVQWLKNDRYFVSTIESKGQLLIWKLQ